MLIERGRLVSANQPACKRTCKRLEAVSGLSVCFRPATERPPARDPEQLRVSLACFRPGQDSLVAMDRWVEDQLDEPHAELIKFKPLAQIDYAVLVAAAASVFGNSTLELVEAEDHNLDESESPSNQPFARVLLRCTKTELYANGLALWQGSADKTRWMAAFNAVLYHHRLYWYISR